MAAIDASNDNCIQETIDFWTRKTGKKITEEDAREMLVNISGFFRVLRKWDDESRRRKAANDELA